MSSSNNHITVSNYEEWFLLYVDEELNAEEKKAVEAFAARYPHLQEELDLLCSTKITAERLTMEGKDELFSGNMKMNIVDESLLLYIDNELAESERMKMEERLAADQDLQMQHLLLLKTKSDASEAISFPDKKSLYRSNSERRTIPYWLRTAAAVVLLAGTGAAFWLNSNNNIASTTPSAEVVLQPAQQKIQDIPHNRMPQVTEGTQPDIDVTAFATETPLEKTVQKKLRQEEKASFAAAVKAGEKKRSNNLPVPVAQEQQLAALEIEKQTPQTPQQIINKDAVTTTEANTYHTTEATNTTPVFATGTSPAETEKSGSLKGLLRKATRFIERRTGVSATNENDELLIGAVAIKLK